MIHPADAQALYRQLYELGHFDDFAECGQMVVGVELMEHAESLSDEELGAVLRFACMAAYYTLPEHKRWQVHERNGWEYPEPDGDENGAETSKPCGNGGE